ncbi:MAG: hypothetical protein ACREMS_03255 [Gemmatimonadaceae bacterium]
MSFARVCACLVITAVGLSAARTSAQIPTQAVQSELRLDAIVARTSAVQAGYGISLPAGIYIRNGLVFGAGAGENGADARVDLISRFSLDPFRENRWAPYGGAGLSGRFRTAADGGSRGYLLVFVGVEGGLSAGARSGWVPAVELGLGGGARVGIILRRGIVGRR